MGRRTNLVPSERAQIYLDLAAERVALAESAPEGSPEAIRMAQEAIGYMGFAVGRHLEHAFPTTGLTEREQWLAVLRFLSGTLMFQYPLEGLALALTELDRGIVPDGLKPSGTARGGKATLNKLYWMRIAVEVLAELDRQHEGGQAASDQFIEDEAPGVHPTTIRKWPRRLAGLAAEHQPHTFRRWMPPPSEPGETYEAKRARLAPLIKALQMACDRAKDGAGKKHSLEKR